MRCNSYHYLWFRKALPPRVGSFRQKLFSSLVASLWFGRGCGILTNSHIVKVARKVCGRQAEKFIPMRFGFESRALVQFEFHAWRINLTSALTRIIVGMIDPMPQMMILA